MLDCRVEGLTHIEQPVSRPGTQEASKARSERNGLGAGIKPAPSCDQAEIGLGIEKFRSGGSPPKQPRTRADRAGEVLTNRFPYDPFRGHAEQFAEPAFHAGRP